MHNLLIVDDERHATSYLNDILQATLKNNKVLFGGQITISNKPSEVLSIVKDTKPILVFLDIQMPQKNGMEVAEEIENYKKENALEFPKIIFTTAYSDYGYQAFQVNAVDYLLKPISEEKLQNALNKFIDRYATNLIKNESINIFHNGIQHKININEVMYFKSDLKYIMVKTPTKEYWLSETLIKLEQDYPHFVKIHRSYLINPLYVLKIFKKDTQYYLSLNNNERLPISRRQIQEVKEKLTAIEFPQIND